QAHGWCRLSGPAWERFASPIRLCLLGEPKPGRRQAVKAEAARRGRDSASLYGLRPVRFTAASSKGTCPPDGLAEGRQPPILPDLTGPHRTRVSDATR